MQQISLPEIIAHLRAAPAWQRKHEIDLLGGLGSLAPLVAGPNLRFEGADVK